MTHPVQVQDPLEQAFLAGIAQQEFLLPFCGACEQPHWYPRPFCPHCGERAIRLRAACGKGEIYALTLVHAKGRAPECLAYVRLREGVTVLGNVIDADVSRAHIGQPVVMVFQSDETGGPVAAFRLAGQ